MPASGLPAPVWSTGFDAGVGAACVRTTVSVCPSPTQPAVLAIVAGLLFKLLPALLDNWGLPADLLTILFGVGILQVLLTAPAGLVYQFPRDMKALGGLIWRLARRVVPAGGRAS